MGIFYQVRGKLTYVFLPPAGQKIGRECFLHPHLPDVFFITQHSVNGGGTPFRFARYRFDAAFLQVALDPAHPIALDVELEDFANDLGLLRHNLKDAIRPFGVAKELRVVQHSFSASHSVADAELDILAAEMALGLIQSRKLVDHTVANVHSV